MYNHDYASPLVMTYPVPAVNLVGAAAIDLRIGGPEGMVGRVVAVTAAISTAVTVAASTVTIGIVGTVDTYATLPVPIQAANTVANANLVNLCTDANLIPADSIVHVGNSGGSTAGVADVYVTIAWFTQAAQAV